VSAQITFNEFLGDGLILAVFGFRSETSKKTERGEEKDEGESFNAKDRFHWRAS
jgi:hypothetical protein